jgi:hypothetical protein
MQTLSVIAGYVPYGVDILKGRAQPARSTRVMFVLLSVVTLWQQVALHSGSLVMVTLGELIGACGIFVLALKRGEGGLSRLDKWCYTLLALDMLLWAATGNTLVALHLSVVADTIAFIPTLVKTWRRPHSETPIFFVIGTVAPVLNIFAAGQYSYAVLLYPVYLVVMNLLELVLIIGRGRFVRGGKPQPTEPVV